MVKRSLPPQSLEWVQTSLGQDAKILSHEPLPGATSSTLHRLNISQQGRAYAVVLRRFTNAEWLKDEPDLALHEAKSLEMAGKIGIPVPELIAYDENGSGCDLPAVLMTHLPGRVVLQPEDMDAWLSGLAEMLIPIHQVGAGDFPWLYYTYEDIDTLQIPKWSQFPKRWEEGFDLLRSGIPAFKPVFIHRDYHPANILWQNSRPSGVVDWVDSCLGPAGIDLGHCRVNLAQLYGVEIADRFLESYQSLAGGSIDNQHYWDLLTLIDIYPDPSEMYSGWVDFGFPHLSKEVLVKRLDEYLLSILEKRRKVF